jgi:4-carboxymuconolactone decarboxylase
MNSSKPWRMAACVVVAASLCGPATAATPANQEQNTVNAEQTLSRKQQAIGPIAAATAVGDMPQLNATLNQGLDAGLTVGDAKEILV